MLEYENEDLLIEWAEARIPHCHFRDDAHAIGIVRDGDLRGVFVFDTFSGTTCMIHVASDGSRTWLGRNPQAIFSPVFAYPFRQCGFSRLTALISEKNRASLRFAERMGGVREGILREAGPEGENMIILGMLRRECRWLLASPTGKKVPEAV